MTPERTCPPVPESRKLERGGAVRASGRAERLTASARAAVRGDVAPSNAGGGTVCGRLRWRTEQGPPGQNRAPQNDAGVRRPPHAPPPGPGGSLPVAHRGLRFLGTGWSVSVSSLLSYRPPSPDSAASGRNKRPSRAERPRVADSSVASFWGSRPVRAKPSPRGVAGQEDLMLRWLAHVLGPSRSRWL